MNPLSDSAVEHLARVSDWPDLSGTRYSALDELGRGGMGVVYRAHDQVLDREVALKILHQPDPSGTLTERLSREARILARLEHPGIVPVYDLGRLPDGRPFYVMKLVRGERLDHWLGRDRTERERIDLLRRVAETVGFAHAHGVVHRDLKPANVMVGEFGEVLVLDWGVAKLTDGRTDGQGGSSTVSRTDDPSSATRFAVNTDHGTVIGTAGFMAPEQARGEVQLIDQRTDVYGLGALLGAMVTPPPKRLAAVAARAMVPEPENRYPDAGSFARELIRYQEGLPLEAYRETLLERAERIVARHQTAILLVLAYLLMRAIFLMFWER
jgi:serine/threonine protein kinase